MSKPLIEDDCRKADDSDDIGHYSGRYWCQLQFYCFHGKYNTPII